MRFALTGSPGLSRTFTKMALTVGFLDREGGFVCAHAARRGAHNRGLPAIHRLCVPLPPVPEHYVATWCTQPCTATTRPGRATRQSPTFPCSWCVLTLRLAGSPRNRVTSRQSAQPCYGHGCDAPAARCCRRRSCTALCHGALLRGPGFGLRCRPQQGRARPVAAGFPIRRSSTLGSRVSRSRPFSNWRICSGPAVFHNQKNTVCICMKAFPTCLAGPAGPQPCIAFNPQQNDNPTF